MTSTALVLFSGGQDSTTCLAWALQRYDRVETIGFDYGQRHAVELVCRKDILATLRTQFPAWATKLGDDHMLDMTLLSTISDTAMTCGRAIKMEQSGLPNTFVPGRNLLFFTYAAAVAYRRGLKILVGGMCELTTLAIPTAETTRLSLCR
jgi:7-cyano-7-deazaguanine synthase